MDTAAKQLGLSVRWLQKVSLRLMSSKKSEVEPWQQAQRLTLAVRSQFPLQRSRLLLPCSIEHSLQKKTVLLGRWGSVSTVLFFSCLLKHRDALFSTRKKERCYRYLNLCCFKNTHLPFCIRGKGSIPLRRDVL